MEAATPVGAASVPPGTTDGVSEVARFNYQLYSRP